MAYSKRGPSLGDIILGFVVILVLAGWGLYELCCALAETFE